MDSEFEQRLRRQPVKKVPEAWRTEILAAVAADVNRRQESSRELTFAATRQSLAPKRSGGGWLSTLNHQLSTLLWPHPKAWAGLAAMWLVILALNLSIRDKPPALAEKSTPPSPEVVAELRQQQKMLAELIGPAESRVADRQRFLAPKPRSERAEIMAV